MQEQQQVMQMQHSMNMNMMSTNYYPNNNLTTHHIQQYLDENKSLILKIVESQNAGKLSECAENQARLQRNLMYLAAIADSQPQPTMHSQYGQSGMMQSGPHYLQGQQAQQAGRSSMLYTQQQYSALQQQQALHSQLGMGSSGSGTHMLHSEANTSQLRGFPDMRGMTGGGGSKQNSDDGDDNN